MRDLSSYYNCNVCVYYVNKNKLEQIKGYLLGIDNHCLLLINNDNVLRLPLYTIRDVQLI